MFRIDFEQVCECVIRAFSRKYTTMFLISYYGLICQLYILVVNGQLFVELSNMGFQFSPNDEEAVRLLERNANTIAQCAQICHWHALCRTFNFDSQSKRCRLYENDIDETDSVVLTTSVQTVVGSIQMREEDFSNRGLACSACENSRYLVCIGSTCQCQPHTFFNGSVCRSQKTTGGSCTNDLHCRHDLNLTCLSNMQCGCEYRIFLVSRTMKVIFHHRREQRRI